MSVVPDMSTNRPGGGISYLYVKGDINGDFCVNVADLLIVRDNIGKTGSAISPPEADAYGSDGMVNVSDLLFVREWLGNGDGCP